MIEIHQTFPRTKTEICNQTSGKTIEYNCIAWAMGDNQRRWWPHRAGGLYYWPKHAPRERTIAAFTAVFFRNGYKLCGDAELEAGFEKLALYAKAGGKPTHAARQLENGLWSSKCGTLEDVEHTLAALEGDEYGFVVRIYKRPRLMA